VSSTSDASAPAGAPSIPAIVTAFISDTGSAFLDVRTVGQPERTHVGSLRRSGWSGTSIDSSELDRLTTDAPDLAGATTTLRLLVVDEPSLAARALAALEAQSISPWLIVVSPSAGDSSTALADLRHLLFDGVNDYFAASGQEMLAGKLSTAISDAQLTASSLRRWRASALEGWYARGSASDAFNAAQELIDIKQTLSWRVTRPLRAVRRRLPIGTAS
jgi:hypothetical protein